MTDRWNQIQDLFFEVIERNGDDRKTYLEAMCGTDADLRREVESLVAAHERASTFLEELPSTEQLTGKTGLPGQTLGPYRLVREIGRGGMGEVYLAGRADGLFEKHVALKLVRSGAGSYELMRRFEYERKILASLEHPNIARLYDAGVSPEGIPYLVMEYVEGVPIDEYCDQHALTIESRLDLFLSVCEAVHYAHRNLIVHRDLKPSNILVNGDGAIKLLDFGIAKLIGPETVDQDTMFTRTGLRVMTPEYASPEQVRGEAITTASDVYALGIVLYRLLTGRRPYDLSGLTPGEIERVVCDSEPIKPSTAITRVGRKQPDTPTDFPMVSMETTERWRKQLVGDLDMIVSMALRKEPGRRYQTVDAFAVDIRRHRSGLPVYARPDTFGYRTSKFIHRHRGAVVATGAVMVLLAAIAVLSVQYAVTSHRQSQLIRMEAEKAERTSRFLQEMLSSADPYEEGSRVTVVEVLNEAAKRLPTELAAEPDVRSALEHTIGVTYMNLGLYEAARPHLTHALETRRRLKNPDPVLVAQSLKDLALLEHNEGYLNKADTLYQAAMALFASLKTGPIPEYAEALNDYGTFLTDYGRHIQAFSVLQQATQMYRDSGNDGLPSYASAVNNLAIAVHYTGDVNQAESLYTEALRLHRRMQGNDHVNVAHDLNNLAFVAREKGNQVRAESLFNASLAIREKVLPAGHMSIGIARYNLANQYLSDGKPRKADQFVRRALSIWENNLPPGHTYIGRGYVTLGRVQTAEGRIAEGESSIQKALQILKKTLPADHELIIGAGEALGQNLIARKRYAEAEPYLKRQYEWLKGQYGPDHFETRRARTNVESLYEKLGKPPVPATAVGP